MSSDNLPLSIKGHVLIVDDESGEIILDKTNAIHNKNMLITIARGLTNEAVDSVTGLFKNQIFSLKLGNGGSIIDSMGTAIFLPPNVKGQSASLHNSIHHEYLDQRYHLTPSGNFVEYIASQDETDAVVAIRCTATLNKNLKFNINNPTNQSEFIFDELGLFTSSDEMLTHLIFSQILKTTSKTLKIMYTVVISVA